ncbi:signal peptidase II [Clostridium gasigenes]|uniref:signal peptidase II n=1 Tax=Clostridium gasigenes TaxID=94869 RepID=UPI001C0D0302|nr:signal peptidase II [Clostridium gasigenes]MBU3109914.1 signal peptidase II [Clostridium gasigenes]
MKKVFNNDKLLTIGILPIMWLAYFLFEIITGRVKDMYTFILNLSLIIVFAIVGLIIYILGERYSKGFSGKKVFSIFSILMLIDQGLKLVIKFFFFNNYFEIIPKFLSFNPIINTEGSWLNARFNFGVSFAFLILINVVALILFLELYRYYIHNGNKNFWADLCFTFISAGALCSLIDKVFYGGSLDFIGISDLFIADIKDIYINIGILFFVMTIYKSGYLKDDEEPSLKDDLKSIKTFLIFARKDIFKR